MNSETIAPKLSLTHGGPAYSFFRWSRLGDNDLLPVEPRVLVAIAATWLVMLVLTFVNGGGFSSTLKLSFVNDIFTHVKFLVALPIFIAAEPYIQKLIAEKTTSFLKRNIIRNEDIPKFVQAIERAHRIRDSWILEAALVVAVYVIGYWIWRTQGALDASTWYASPGNGALNLTPAGYWLVLVATPVLQFLSIRWYVRFFIWFWFLRQVSKLDLNLIPSHPDRSGGLGFLGKATYAFGPILFAQGAILAGSIANQVLHNGRDLMSFRMDALLFVLFFVGAVISPLFVFVPDLVRTKRRGLSEFGALASRYTEGFERKWIKGENPSNEELLGSGDIQSLADLGNSYSVVREMNMAPFVYKDLLRLAAAAAAPLVPLLFLIFSPEEIVEKLIHFVI